MSDNHDKWDFGKIRRSHQEGANLQEQAVEEGISRHPILHTLFTIRTLDLFGSKGINKLKGCVIDYVKRLKVLRVIQNKIYANLNREFVKVLPRHIVLYSVNGAHPHQE